MPHAVSPVSSADRLSFTFFLAAVVHAGLVLGISFSLHDSLESGQTSIEVTIAHRQSVTPQEEADFLAPVDQLGSGSLDEKRLLTTTELADFEDAQVREVKPLSQPEMPVPPRPEARRLLTTVAQSQVLESQAEDDELPEVDLAKLAPQPVELDMSQEIASLEAKLHRQIQAYANRPRIKVFNSVSTKSAVEAAYINNWTRKVEHVGNSNFPREIVQHRLHGDVRLEVTLKPDGSVQSVIVLESSGQPMLDQAATRIVHQAARFSPFPAEISREADLLVIIRTWRFINHTLSGS